MIRWITGNSEAGKTTLARGMRRHEIILDGDALRGVWPGLDWSEVSRREQNLRTARLAKLLEDQGFDVIVATICPYRDLREQVRSITGCEFIYLEGGREGPEYPYERPD